MYQKGADERPERFIRWNVALHSAPDASPARKMHPLQRAQISQRQPAPGQTL